MKIGWLVFIGAVLALAVGFWLGRKSKRTEIEQLESAIGHKKYQLTDLTQRAEQALQRLQAELIENRTFAQNSNDANALLRSQLASEQKRSQDLAETNDRLREFYSNALENLRNEGALFPAAVRWADTLQKILDQIIVNRLASPPHPAPSAAMQVKEARALARQWKQEAELFHNRIDLYEAQAPWLVEFAEYSVDDIIAGLKQEREIRQAYVLGEDPVKLFLSPDEWDRLSDTDRNQLALDRYWESSRKRSAWAAGIQYERYIGYLYEREGFEVEYHGAILGKEDLGIDLICKRSNSVRIVQCKRLSPTKGIPVRENVVAQIYGAGMFYAMRSGTDMSMVKPVIATTYELSNEARQFAEILGVSVRENISMERYPSIKCNISERTGDRIYHLPFDQQYDSTKIGNVAGECYVTTVLEAEKAKFRRAFRWHGNAA